jgi:cytochrome P450
VSPGKIIGGQHVPAGTIVSNLPYTTQRDPSVFSDPEKFEPARWESPTPQMKVMNRPFSSGPRNCVGMHLARVQLLLTVTALYQRFDIALDPATTEEMMVLRDQGIMTPIGKKLYVRIERRAVN